jgi:hypothetical protein
VILVSELLLANFGISWVLLMALRPIKKLLSLGYLALLAARAFLSLRESLHSCFLELMVWAACDAPSAAAAAQ